MNLPLPAAGWLLAVAATSTALAQAQVPQTQTGVAATPSFDSIASAAHIRTRLPLGHSPLDSLAAIGVARSLSRRVQEYSLDVARAGVSQARGMYLPSATFNARYTRVQGNTVNIGTLINPAFGALNELLQRPQFPTNLDFQLPLRQETTVRLTQPIFQPAVIEANRMAGASADAQQAVRDASVRQLDADIRLAYLTYARARRMVEQLESTLQLATEHQRVSERLLAAGTVTPDVVLRARAERSAIAQRLDEARQGATAARFALNVAINAPIDADVPLFADSALMPGELPRLPDATSHAIAAREELRAVDHSKRVSDARRRLAQGSFLPNVAVAFDYGVQGREYHFDRASDFSAVTLLVSWNVFNGGQDAARVQAASLESRRAETERHALERAIELQVATAWDAARVAISAVATADERLEAARRAFEVVRRRHAQGAATQLEYLDGQTTLTSASLNAIVTRYDALARRVELDRAAALTPLPTPSALDQR